MLFKYYGNMFKWKSMVNICIVLFKQRKLLFIQHNQTAILDSVIMVWIISVEFLVQAYSQGVSKSKPRLVVT